ncbi:MAG: hypothetical protein FJ090_12860 [Deltaproteobacteria bacterium]|nr:hypothetical protein [Deltaproteobacteria bacterium]
MNWALLLACTGAQDPEKDTIDDSGERGDSAADSVDTDVATGDCPPGNGYAPAEPHAARTLAGSADWTLDFDAAAEAQGYADCSYHREYAEMVEVEGHRWACPACDWFTLGEATITSGYEDCYLLISTGDAVRNEHLGLGEVDGALHFWRTGSENVALGDMGPVTGTGSAADPYLAAWEDEGEIGDGAFTLVASGAFVTGERGDVKIADVDAPLGAESSCGWPMCNPGGPTESYVLATGGTFPNARLFDQCAEQVDIWDFWGRYLVIDSSAPDCGPCIAIAQEEAAWVEAMAAEGIEVEWITLLNSSLGAINLPASSEQVDEWIEGTGTTGAVLQDEGFAYAVMPAYAGYDSGMSYPTMMVVNRDMELIGWDGGYNGDDPFGVIERLVLEDLGN